MSGASAVCGGVPHLAGHARSARPDPLRAGPPSTVGRLPPRFLTTDPEDDSEHAPGLSPRWRAAERYAIVRTFTARLNCLPIRAAKAGDAALTLPISFPLLKS
jgi:hypothetical protein